MTPEDFIVMTQYVNARAKAAEALLRWYETTHGNEFGHDHHCTYERFSGPPPGRMVPTGQPCTCGWLAFLEAEAAVPAKP